MAGRKNFVAGEILLAADVNSFLQDQTVMVFDDDDARATAIPSPSEGMTTYLKTDKRVEVFNGSSFGPVGTILQVVSTTKTNTFSQSVSGNSFSNDVTGYTVTITPVSTTSKVLVSVQGHAHITVTVGGLGWVLRRNGSDIARNDAGVRLTGQTGADSDGRGNTIGAEFLDSPNTTSAVTYSIRFFNPSGQTRALFLNRNHSDTMRSISTITAMEVAV